MLNSEVFENIKNATKQILIVTKYWDKETTLNIYSEAKKEYIECIFGIGENRIETIREKTLPKEHVHFIGNIQSQKIPEIIKLCSTIHSLSSIKHARKIENQGVSVKAFIQIKLDKEKDIGIGEDQIGEFLEYCKIFKNLKIVGISGMGAGDVSEKEKRQEFQKLISLRDTYIPHGLISAGTSRDYEIALEEGVDIVRVGSAVIKK